MPNIGNINDYKDNTKEGMTRRRSTTNIGAITVIMIISLNGKDKVFDKKNNITEDSDCTKIDKGKVKVNNKYDVEVLNKIRHRCKIKLSKEGVSTAHQ